MTRTRRFTLLAGLAVGIAVITVATVLRQQRAAAQEQFEQPALARQLLSDDIGEQRKALVALREIGAANVGGPLRSAMVALLDRKNRKVAEAREKGVALDALEDPEFVSAVQREVAALQDPRAISAMARALGMFTLIRPLAAFGEPAAAPVLAVVNDPASHYSAVDDGLRVLRFMVEQRDVKPLSPSTIAQIREAVTRRLTGEQYFTTLWYAIDLAAVVETPELRRTIEDIASSPSEVLARGVSDPGLVEKTRQRAADRLQGVPALPRPE